MDFLTRLRDITPHVLTGKDAASYGKEWTGKYPAEPAVVIRPGSTAEVSAIMALAHETGTPIVPQGGRTGLTGATATDGVILSLERMNAIREIRADARLAVVEAGVILQSLHDKLAGTGLKYPMTFGARGSCMIGGNLATNAGGSNVLRYGNTRALCLGLEVVLADGRIVDLMSELHKDNSGYDLKDLLIGSEGTLGIITAAVLKLVPEPRAYATSMVVAPDLKDALKLLNRLQEETGGAVEAFEFMPREYMARLKRFRPDLVPPLGYDHDVSILLEVGATAPRDAIETIEGTTPVVERLMETLSDLLDEGAIIDATVAQNEAQRRTFWEIRESAAEITLNQMPIMDADVAVPLDHADAFMTDVLAGLSKLDPEAASVTVSHLGDGNLHFTAFPSRDAPDHIEAIREMVEDVTVAHGGSFSAEHGIGLAKLGSMRRRKNPVAIDMMRAIKTALDPKGILNPGKTLP